MNSNAFSSHLTKICFKKKTLLLSLFFLFSQIIIHASSQKNFVVIIPSYNNENWYRFNLDSVLKQKYDQFRVIYIDDASTDRTADLVKEYLALYDMDHKVTLISNWERVGALANIYRAVWMCDSSDIIVTVDGDDWLAHEDVLQTLNEIYSDPEVWMTYGQFQEYPTGYRGGAALLPMSIIAENSYRDHDWMTTHLRTFYAGLFQKIKREDFLYEGKFFPVAWDLAFMFPMLEMSGFHSRFVPEIIYIYNVATPLNDRKLYLEMQLHLEKVIRAKNRYSPIEKLN